MKCESKVIPQFPSRRREQVWSQTRNCGKFHEEGEILNDLLREDGIARIRP